MTDSRRWLETGNASAEALELLRNAAAPRPLDPATRARSRRRLAALSALPVALGGFFWLQPLALGALLGAVAMGAATLPGVLKSQSTGTVASTSARVAPPKSNRSPSPVSNPSAGPVEAVIAPSPSPPPSIASTLLRLTPKALPSGAFADSPPIEARELSSAETVEPDLVREARLLEGARALLTRDPARALSALHGHELSFPTGALALEREFLSVDALMRLGRPAEARARAQRLRARAPGSLYEERLERLLKSAPAATWSAPAVTSSVPPGTSSAPPTAGFR